MKDGKISLVVIGAGYLGLATGVAFAYLGKKVAIVEKDKEKLDLLKQFKSYFYEPFIEELMQLSSSNLVITDNLPKIIENAQIIMIAVGTPHKENGQADNRYIDNAAFEIGNCLAPGKEYMIVIKSTVPIGTNRRVAYIINRQLEERKLKDSVKIIFASNPEFLREGQALYDMLYPERIIIGVERKEDSELLKCLYEDILESSFMPPNFIPRPESFKNPELIITDPASAELIKYAANAFLAMKISFINEIAGFCELIGANINDVAKGLGSDHRIGRAFLEAGIGWGGSCLPKDTAALLTMGREFSCPMKLVEAAREANYRQRLYAVEKLQKSLQGVRGKIIGILGIAFKPGTDDIRESPSIDLVKLLLERESHVRIHDPLAIKTLPKYILEMGIEIFEDPYAMSIGADAIVLATKWPEYKDLDYEYIYKNMQSKVFLDGRNFLNQENMKKIGFDYIGFGIK